jgi:hypothetical protein
LAEGEPRYDDLEQQLAEGPVITVPAITLEGDANGAPHRSAASYRQKFSGRYEHRAITGGVGHNLPQEAPQAFAQAVIDVGGYARNAMKSPADRRTQSAGKYTLGKVLGVPTALIAADQIQPVAAQFMQAINGSMERMDRQMATAPMNGNADHDFASMMIPHHKGAIDMAKAELIYGKDPVMRRLAQEILVDQQSEIDAMQLWLERTSAGNPRKEK